MPCVGFWACTQISFSRAAKRIAFECGAAPHAAYAPKRDSLRGAAKRLEGFRGFFVNPHILSSKRLPFGRGSTDNGPADFRL